MGVPNGKVALVSGASKGIGAGIAKALAQHGAAVVVNHASSSEGADRDVAEVASKGGKAVAVPLTNLCADSGREFLGQIARPSQKFPDELKRNRQKRTRDTARWILMFLGRLASNRDEM